MHNRNPSATSNALSARSDATASQDEEIAQYVKEFRREVEHKFRKSSVNSSYIFPRRPDKPPSRRDLRNDSPDSLRDVTFYDLESQNAKTVLLSALHSKRKSETTALVEVINKLGRLDPRYLASQIRNCESTFFKILYQSVQKKATKDFKSKDSLKSCSVKTKQIFATEKLKSAKGSRREDGSVSFQRHFLPGDGTARGGATKMPSIHQIVVGGGPSASRGLLHPDSGSRGKGPGLSLSPRVQRSRIEGSLKPLKSEKQLPKPTPQLLRSGFLKTSVLNSSSQARLGAAKPETVSVFQAVRANFVKTKTSNNKSKSKLKTPRQTVEAKPVPLKSHISLTKEQLRSLIQKNIYKPAPGFSGEPADHVPAKAVARPEAGGDARKRHVVHNLSSLKGRLVQGNS